tara:strand:+ start:2685 stop:3443 length:759 start_codon:yes stop_codon:yes gene_type:complete
MVSEVFVYTLLSVFAVSLISFIGVFTLSLRTARLKKFLILIISFSAGALLGDAFIHLLPEIVEEAGFGLNVSLGLLGGIGIFFVLEKFIHWEHCHGHMMEEGHVHAFAYTNLFGDGLHNFLDGMIIAASYLVSLPAGIATTVAVILHEIPQEIGDFGVLLHAGFSKGKALLVNFASGLVAVLGALFVFLLDGKISGVEEILVPIAAGGFIYIAASDLIPEIHKHSDSGWKSLLQLIALTLGVAAMAALLLLE